MDPWIKSTTESARQDPQLALSEANRVGAIAARMNNQSPFEANGTTRVPETRGPNVVGMQAIPSFAIADTAPAKTPRPRAPPPPPKKPSLSKNFPSPGGSQLPTPPSIEGQSRALSRDDNFQSGAPRAVKSRAPPLPPRRPQPLPSPPTTPELGTAEFCAAFAPSSTSRQDRQHVDANITHSPPRLPPRRPTSSALQSVPPVAKPQPGLSQRSTLPEPRRDLTPPSPDSRASSPGIFGSKTPKKSNGLCSECSKIDFAQFANKQPELQRTGIDQDTQPTAHLINLKHLLSKRHNCNFCSLLFRTLCIPTNDPLRDEELQESIQKDKKFHELRSKEAPCWVDFGTWAANREKFNVKKEAKWPFGHTYDNVNVKEIKADDEREVDFDEVEGSDRRDAAAINHGARAGLAAGKHFDNNGDRAKAYGFAMDVLPDMGVINAMTKKGVPAVVRVVVHGISHPRSGVLEVTVFGCAKARGRDIKTLSYFNLRVASPVPSTGREQNAHLRYGRLVDRSAIDLNLCRKWLTHCCTVHGSSCNEPRWSARLEQPSAPFRLVDVLDGCIVERDPRQHHYAALSYVWGDVSHRAGILSLSNENVRSLSAPGALSQHYVGRTISDAMDIVRSLGMRYLWADRLCVIQDSETDKAHQIGQMDRVYGGATVTLVAASGTHLNEPIAGISTARSASQVAERVTSDPPINVLVPMQSGRYPDLNPWAGRAWTLQEKLLSKRLLIFHDGVVDFRCPQGTMHEDMSALDADSRPPAVGWLSLGNTNLFSEVKAGSYGRSGPRLLRSSIFTEYAGLIEEYTPRQMTNSMDAVNAVMGMLKILIVNQQDQRERKRLLHGLPEEFFDQAVHWQFAAKEGARFRLRKDRLFPTWSWAAWEGAGEVDSEPGQPVLQSGGVQYEATYRVQTDHRGQLQKVLHKNRGSDSQDPEERLRPLLRWYTVDNRTPPSLPPRTQAMQAAQSPGRPRAVPPPLPPRKGSITPISNPSLRPLNGNGLGLVLSSNTSVDEWTASASAATKNVGLERPVPALPSTLVQRLRPGHHLVFRTLMAQFSLGETRTRTEMLWRKMDDGKLVVARELHIRETAVIGSDGREVGRVVLPVAMDPGTVGEFVILSEAQFFGDEESIEVGEYPLFNIMLLTWNGDIAERVGLGKITKEGWWAAKWREEIVVLG